MNDIHDEYHNLPRPPEATEAELKHLTSAEGPPLVDQDLADHIWERIPREDDTSTWERIARDCLGDRKLADLMLDSERIMHRQTHPSYTHLSAEEYERKLAVNNERIERRTREIEERQVH